MTDEVVAKVASMSDAAFSKALEYVEATEAFVTEQAPLLIQEVLAWGFAENLIYAVSLVATSFALMSGVVKIVLGLDDNEAKTLVIIFGGGFSLVPIIVAFSYILEAVKISVAPRLYLLEVFSDLL